MDEKKQSEVKIKSDHGPYRFIATKEEFADLQKQLFNGQPFVSIKDRFSIDARSVNIITYHE